MRYYFDHWAVNMADGTNLYEQALKKSVRRQYIENRRTAKTSFCIVDAQCVKNTDTARAKGYDAGKKVSDI